MSLIIGNTPDGTKVEWPVDAVTETFGVVGVRGSGKTTTVKVIVEELTRAHQQTVIIDPLGVWWGLKASASDIGPGYPFTILGGTRADIPITERAGPLIADLAIDSSSPLVIDLSLMRKAEAQRFMTGFIDQLYHRAHGKPLHVVVDECDLFIPQRPIKGAEVLVGGMEDLVRRGRNKGLGVSLISQRPASVNKDVLSQVSVLIAHRLTGPQDRAALDAWVEAHGSRERRNEMMASLASLDTGSAWFWSPQWQDMFTIVDVRRPITFDSSATPKAGTKRIEPKQLAKPDIAALKLALSDIAADADANNPGVLKRRIAELEKQLRAHKPEQIVTVTETVTVEVVPPKVVEAVNQLRRGLDTILTTFSDVIAEAVARNTAQSSTRTTSAEPMKAPVTARHTAHGGYTSTGSAAALAPPPRGPAPGSSPNHIFNIELPKAERTLLNILAQFPQGRTKKQLSFLSGYSYRASSYRGAMAGLRARGFVNTGEPIQATAEGIAAIDVEPLPTGPALLEHWRSELDKASVTLLDLMIKAWPDEMTKDMLGELSGYSPAASSFRGAMATLRKMDLVDGFAIHPEFAEAVGL